MRVWARGQNKKINLEKLEISRSASFRIDQNGFFWKETIMPAAIIGPAVLAGMTTATAVATTAVVGAVMGAAIGATIAGFTGGDILKGALMGAAGGAIGGAISGLGASSGAAAAAETGAFGGAEGAGQGMYGAGGEVAGGAGMLPGDMPQIPPGVTTGVQPVAPSAPIGGTPPVAAVPAKPGMLGKLGDFFKTEAGAETIKGGLGTLKGLLLDDEAEKAQRTSDIAVEERARIQAQNRPAPWPEKPAFTLTPSWQRLLNEAVTGYTAPLKKGVLQPEVIV